MAPSNKPHLDLSVYLVTDSRMVPEAEFLATVEAALQGGVTLLQLREKSLDTALFADRARATLALARKYGVPLLINDRLDVALAVGADGVHLGQDDLDAHTARALLGPNKIVGVTVHNVAQAVAAAENGADYLGTCAIFDTATKAHPDGFVPLGIEGVRTLLADMAEHPRLAKMPIVTIGGLNAENIGAVMAETANPRKQLDGVAVVSAIMAQPDARAATAELVDIVKAGKLVPSAQYVANADDALVQAAAHLLAKLRSGQTPLVHHLTNFVVMNDNANAALHIGGSPVMAHAVQEMNDMTGFASALVINVGTLSEHWIEAMVLAGKVANERGIPVILDPVGAGATAYRRETCERLLREVQFAVIKGNAGEIAALANLPGLDVEMRGVDSGDSSPKARIALSRALAQATGAVVALTGATDFISYMDGDELKTVALENGSAWLGKLTGTGCTTATLVGCFAGVADADQRAAAAVAGVLSMGIAAELAVPEAKGPASFKVALFDHLYALQPEDLVKHARVRVVEVTEDEE
ncbi:hypothetical protein GGF32_005698 [Allomyces javanicus]|nr:hypothetical protein GGF32_005698 [Allomyces javanicus]